MTKRKTSTREPDDGERRWKIESGPASDVKVSLRCVWHTRVVVSPERTPSGMRYEFDAGQVRDDVHKADADTLLAMQKEQPAGCCGPGAPPVLKYFERV